MAHLFLDRLLIAINIKTLASAKDEHDLYEICLTTDVLNNVEAHALRSVTSFATAMYIWLIVLRNLGSRLGG